VQTLSPRLYRDNPPTSHSNFVVSPSTVCEKRCVRGRGTRRNWRAQNGVQKEPFHRPNITYRQREGDTETGDRLKQRHRHRDGRHRLRQRHRAGRQRHRAGRQETRNKRRETWSTTYKRRKTMHQIPDASGIWCILVFGALGCGKANVVSKCDDLLQKQKEVVKLLN